MKPSEMSAILRRIASAIDKSENPKRELVVRDIRMVLAAITNHFDDKALGEIRDGMDALKKERDDFIKKSEDPSHIFSDYDREWHIWKIKEIVTDLADKLKNYNKPAPPFGTTPTKMRPYVPS